MMDRQQTGEGGDIGSAVTSMTSARVAASLVVIVALVVPGCQRESAGTARARMSGLDTPQPATPASAIPSPTSTPPFPVPGMKRADIGQPCSETEHFIFAISPVGQTLACRGQPPQYYRSADVIGERTMGAPCDEEGLAQSPEGVPMICVVKGQQRQWSAYLAF